MSDVKCPYCGTEQEINHDDGYGYEEDGDYEQSRVAADCPNERIVMCDCYPEHCTHGDTCWCEPTVEIINGKKVIIHNEAN